MVKEFRTPRIFDWPLVPQVKYIVIIREKPHIENGRDATIARRVETNFPMFYIKYAHKGAMAAKKEEQVYCTTPMALTQKGDRVWK